MYNTGKFCQVFPAKVLFLRCGNFIGANKMLALSDNGESRIGFK